MNLSQLSQADKIKLAAELDGHNLDDGTWCKCEDCAKSNYGLSYSSSYDAIIPLIQKQAIGIRISIDDEIARRGLSCPTHYDATPPQLLDALLVATGKAEP